MGSHISGHVFLAVVSVDEDIESFDQVLWVLEIVLNSNKVCDSNTPIFKDTVEVCKAVGYKLDIRLDVLHNIEEASND